MNERHTNEDNILHAYIDGELDSRAKHELLLRMEDDSRLRERICELRHTKEWVKFSFENAVPPSGSGPLRRRRYGWSAARIAASLLLTVAAFAAGWASHDWRTQAMEQLALDGTSFESRHVILHIAVSDPNRFRQVLDRAERLMKRYSDSGIQVEVIANGGGLDLMRTSTSPFRQRILDIMARYRNVRFFACSNGLKRLRETGLDPILIEGVQARMPAADLLIQRLTEGWTYIRV